VADSALVTVAIPTRNRSRLLQETLSSAIAQDYPHLEVLVVDNASTDDTARVVERVADTRLRFLGSDEDIGMVQNFRRAIRESKGDYLVLLGDDDMLSPCFCSTGVASLQGNPEASFWFCGVGFVGDRSGESVWRDLPKEMRGSLYIERSLRRAQNLTYLCGAMIRASAIEESQIPDNVFFDWTMWLSLAQRGDVLYSPRVLAHYRVHDKNETNALARDAITHLAELQRAVLAFGDNHGLSRTEARNVARCVDRLLIRYLIMVADGPIPVNDWPELLNHVIHMPGSLRAKFFAVLRAIMRRARRQRLE
jgi:glycosyltransferase involved in cell wall biosynthesis